LHLFLFLQKKLNEHYYVYKITDQRPESGSSANISKFLIFLIYKGQQW